MPVVTGAAKYPENIIEDLKKKYTVYSIDAMAEAKKLGNPRVFNVIVLGMAARHMDFKEEEWLRCVRAKVPQKLIDINVRAFKAGYQSV